MRKLLCAALALGCSPAFAQLEPLAPVEQAPLAKDAFSTGFLDSEDGALPSDLWRGATAQNLTILLELAPARPASPSIGEALRRVLLSPGEAPAEATPSLGGAKLVALARAGFIDEARRIESLSAGTSGDPNSAQAMAIADILSGEFDAACRRVSDSGDDFWVKLRVVCYAASNNLDAAELALSILGETGRLSETDKAILTPLSAGGKPKDGAKPVDVLHFAAFKIAKAPLTADMLGEAHAGVLKAAAEDAAADWPTRLEAAKQSAAAGALSGAELVALFNAAPEDAVHDYRAIKALATPERLRDKAALIAREIDAATNFNSLYAAALLYAEDVAGLDGVIVTPGEAEAFARTRLAAGDATSAEKWLLAATTSAQGATVEAGPQFAELLSLLAALDAQSAARVAAAANVTITPLAQPAPAAAPAALPAAVIEAAIAAAANGSKGAAALAGLAASSAAAKGDPAARAVLTQSLTLAGLEDLARRFNVEQAIAAHAPSSVEAENSQPQRGIVPRLKPKRAS